VIAAAHEALIRLTLPLPGGEARAALMDSSSEDHDDRRQDSHGVTLHVNH
jgi:hypothetical protein